MRAICAVRRCINVHSVYHFFKCTGGGKLSKEPLRCLTVRGSEPEQSQIKFDTIQVMRVWDIHPKHLCRKHLLGEHRELHGLWNILTKHKGKGGYSRHPETLRWVGRQKALYIRHEALVKEFTRREYAHHSPLDKRLAVGSASQTIFLDSIPRQRALLRAKSCECLLRK